MALDLYVITDEKIGRGHSHAELARLSCEGGADAIQLRDKFRSPGELCGIGRVVRAITREEGALFIVNDNLDVALACGADGVHLGQGDMAAGRARKIAPRPFVIGISAGTVTEAIRCRRCRGGLRCLKPGLCHRFKRRCRPRPRPFSPAGND